MAVDVEELAHGYRTPWGRLTVLDGVTLELPAGGYAAVQGSSGAGKTTLLAVLGGLERPDRGRVRVGDRNVTELSGDDLAAYRRSTVGFVFQHFGLLDTLTASENVELACTLAGIPSAERRRRADRLLDAVGLADRVRHRPPALSGGERQRVAIARALANQPSLLLADEPTGNLDEESSERAVELLESLRVEHGCTLVVVTHDTAIAARAEHQFLLEKGRMANGSAAR